MKLFTLLICFLLPLSAFAQVEEKIVFSSQGNQITGYLSKPEKAQKYPVVVVLHSASHGHHDSDLYNHLEENLTDIGIAVFTYDRRGSGESTGDFQSASLEDLAKDALAAIKTLKKRSDILPDKVGLYGISQGGWIAPIAYSLETKAIQFMILASSCGTSPARQMEYSAVTTLKMNDFDKEVIEKAVHLRSITNEYYRGKKNRDKVQAEIDQYRKEDWFADVYLPWRGNLPAAVENTKWYFEMDFDPKPYFEQVNIPTLLFYGAYDRWVPIEESISIWESAFATTGHEDFEIYRIKNAGHMMILNEDQQDENTDISEEYNNILRGWLSKKVN